MNNSPLHSSNNTPASRFSLVGTLLALALALAVGPAGCMISVEADVPDVEVTEHDIAFAGIPNGASLGELSTAMSFTQERPIPELPNGVDSSVKAVKIELRAKTGIQNFGFLRSLRITMAPKNSAADLIELINYEKTPGAVVGAVLTIPSSNAVNLLEQWKAESAVFTVAVAGTLPEQAWTIDMTVHFTGKASYKY